MFDFLAYDFMIKALVAGIIISILAPMLGIFLLARKSSFMADTLAHTALAGVGFGLMMNFDPLYTAIGASVLAAPFMEILIRKSKMSRDGIQALFLSGALALAILFTNLKKSAGPGLEHYLFGNILTIQNKELILLALCLLITSIIIWKFYNTFILISFNESLAKIKGIDTKKHKFTLAILSAFTIALSMKTMGALLIGALMIIPVLCAGQWARNFQSTLFLSIIFSFCFVLSGLIFSYYLNLPSGSCIVLIGVIFFLYSTYRGKHRF